VTSRDREAGGGIAGLAIVIFIALCLLAAYLFVRGLNKCLRCLARYEDGRKPVLAALVLAVAFAVLALLTWALPFAALALAMFGLAVLLAEFFELRHAEAFEEPAGIVDLSRKVANIYSWWQEAA
jgi:membrane protein implicated in regulation of membrane protease activity